MTPGAWQIMDDWCAQQAQKLLDQTNHHVLAGRDLNDREFRRLLGQSQAFGRMRSFIHSTRNASGMSAGTAETPKSDSGPQDRQPDPEGGRPKPAMKQGSTEGGDDA